MTEQEQREAVVRIARSWVGTPYHHMADVKGAGVDCGMLLVRCYVDSGVLAPFDPRPYPPDWNMHRDEERYLAAVFDHATEVLDGDARPGDLVVWQHGRTFSHGGIVTAWPLVVHAYHRSMIVEECDVDREIGLQFIGNKRRPMRKFTLWGKA